MYLASKQTGRLNQHVAEVSAFLHILLAHVRNAWHVKPSVYTACLAALLRIVQMSSSCLLDGVVLWSDVVGVPIAGARLGLSRNGYVSGWTELARETCSGAFWADQWQRCTDVAFLGHRPASTLDSSQVTDLLVFVCYVVARVPPSHPAWRLSDAAMNTLVGIVTTLFRQKLLIACDVFVAASATSEAAGSSADAPVALRHHGSRRCRRIDPHSAWSLLERADQKRIPYVHS